jgi:tetratricopeptide (TPR) repeat protein
MKRKRLLLLGVAGVVMLSLIAGGAVLHRRHASIQAHLPPVPATADRPAAFGEAHARIRGKVTRWPGSVAALGELAGLYQANGLLQEAMQLYAMLETLQPREPRWPHRHAAILAGYGEVEPAVTRWNRVLILAPDYLPAHLRLGDLLLKADRPTEAAAVWTEVLRRVPDHPYALFGLARIEAEAGRWTEARARLERVVAQTQYALGYDLIVSVCEQQGDLARAAEIRARAKASGAYREFPDPWLDELIDVCHDAYRLALEAGRDARSGEPARARRLLERAIDLSPSDVTLRFQLAGLLSEARDAAGAQQQLERCTQVAPTFADAWAHWAALRQQAGDAAGAARIVATGLQHCPDSPGLHLMRARQWREAGRAGDALGAYQTAIRLRPNEADAYLELATTLFRLERVPEGLAWLERGLAAEPEHPPTLALLALHAIGTGDEAAARGWLQRVARQPRVAPEQAAKLREAFRAQFGKPAP